MQFSELVSRFFLTYLREERGVRANTIKSYRDCAKILINFACDQLAVEPDKLRLEQFTRELIIDFLDHLENVRYNAISTRNNRLAAIKSFFSFLARNVPELMQVNAQIQAIREKATDQKPPPSLTRSEVDAILAVPDANSLIGARDKALLQLLYNCGARVQELADLSVSDVRCDTCQSVKLTGKGGKTRVVPLWGQTIDTIHDYIEFRENVGIRSDHLFLNVRGQAITRFGIGRRVKKHAETAAHDCPSLRDRSISPHVFRHTTALHLLEAGNDINIVQEWLGHANLSTTSGYLEVSIERKRAALEKMPPPNDGTPAERPQWKQSDVMQLLAKL